MESPPNLPLFSNKNTLHPTSAAVQAALLSMRGIKTHNDGIVEEDIERTIRNVGLIGTKGMEETDKTILSIMCNKK